MNVASKQQLASKLPYDAEVEYIQSSGTQYIDTLFSIEENALMVIADYQWVSQTAGSRLFGASNAKDNCHSGILYNDAANNWYVGSSKIGSAGFTFADGVRRIVRLEVLDSHCSIYLDGTLKKTSNYNGDISTIENTVFLFSSSYRQNVPQTPSKYKVFSFSIFTSPNSTSPSVDFIPVRFTNENGVSEGAMYDRVSGKLFRNAGTGAFVIGPDKKGNT